jgi:hypothetical protein
VLQYVHCIVSAVPTVFPAVVQALTAGCHRTWVGSIRCKAAFSRRFPVMRKLPYSSHLPHRKRVTTAPRDRLPRRRSVVLGHRLRRRPASRSASRTAPSRSPSAVRKQPLDLRVEVPGPPVICAVPLEHLRPTTAPLASLSAHSSHLANLTAPHSAVSSCEDSSGHRRRSRPVYVPSADFKIRCTTHLFASSVRTPAG